MKICSLLPSTTEIVCALGLEEELVAITHECDFPASILDKPVVTRSLIDHSNSNSSEINTHISEALHNGSGIYEIITPVLDESGADIILTQELCEVCAVSYSDVEKSIRQINGNQKILSFEPNDLNGILESIEQIGHHTNTAELASKVTSKLKSRIEKVKTKSNVISQTPKVLAMEWLTPPFIGGHWVPEMIQLAGGINVIGEITSPSREITWEEALDAEPDIVILMVCGFDLDTTIKEFKTSKTGPFWKKYSGQIYATDGSAYFSRPGPRIVDGLEILSEIIHPKYFPKQSPENAWKQLA